MKGGDLSNLSVPHLVVVYEWGLTNFTNGAEAWYDKLVKKGDWTQAIYCWEFKETMMRKIMDLTYRQNFNINIVTWMGDDAADAITEQMNEENIPVRGCFASTPQRLARSLPYNPQILCVYDPDPANVLVYGSKGVVLKTPEQLGKVFRG